MTGKCSIDDCPFPARTRTWCNMHYERWRTKGSVGGAKQIRRSLAVHLDGRNQIPLTRGKVALVDETDYDRVMSVGIWHALKSYAPPGQEKFYACHNTERGGTLYLHRFIMGARPGQEVDHRDNDGLNNQRYNLRFATSAQNKHNQGGHVGSTSAYRGVSWYKDRANWRAVIRENGKPRFLGYFESEEDAARAWDEVARRIHGEFVRLNFPDTHDYQETR